MQELGFFLGRFHVLLLHLPIGIVIAAVVLDWLARRPRYARARERRTAAVGVGRDLGRADGDLGYLHFGEGSFTGPSAEAHRLWGTITASPPWPVGGSRAAAAARARRGSRPASRCSRSSRSRATTAAT